MSCVCSKQFRNVNGNTLVTLKSFGIDDTFQLELERRNIYEGYQKVSVELSVEEAKDLQEQLNKFLSQNK